MIDTQADISIIRKSSINKLFGINNSNIIKIKGITQDHVKSLGTTTAYIFLENCSLPVLFHVVPDVFDIPSDGILGKDFIKNYRCNLNYGDMTVSIEVNNNKFIIPILDGLNNNVVLPARSEVVRHFSFNTDETVVVLNQEIFPGLYVPRTIVSSRNPLIPIMNTTSNIRTISKSYPFKTEPISNFKILNMNAPTTSDEGRLQNLLQIISDKTHPAYRESVLSLGKKYPEIFALETDPMTTNNFYSQKLRISDDSPVYIKNYRQPHSQIDEIERQTKKLLENNLIEPSNSNYNSPIILVPKKGNTSKWRMCIDFRSVNKKLIADKYPLPRIEDILDNLGRSKFFSVLDLYSGFHQIPLHEDSRDITSFSTNSGSYRWKVLPFGLNVSPNSFSRMMNLAFSGATPFQCFIYMDDIIVIGCSEKHHLKNLESVFQICKK